MTRDSTHHYNRLGTDSQPTTQFSKEFKYWASTLAVLQVVHGDAPGEIIALTEELSVFGRHPKCQVVLNHSAVSRHHAQLIQNDEQFELEDLKSQNGTMLNGALIDDRVDVKDADEIRICGFTFRFYIGEAPDLDELLVDDDTSDRMPDSDGFVVGESAGLEDQLRQTVPIDDGFVDLAEASGDEPIEFDSDISDSRSSHDDSSIVAKIEMGSSRNLRLDLKPEAKLKAIVEISNSLGHVLDLDEVLSRGLDGLFKLFPQAEDGFVLLHDAGKSKLILRASHTKREDDESSVQISMTIVRQALHSQEAILCSDAVKDHRFSHSESIAQLRLRSVICVPLMDSSDHPLGVIQINTADQRLQFAQDDLDLMVSVASQLSRAMENAMLHTEVLKQRELEREIAFASQVQLDFLPKERPSLPCYEFGEFYEAAKSVGGDFFDYVRMPDGRIAVAVADVSGKGVAAALMMSKLYSMTRYHLLTQPSLADAMNLLNIEVHANSQGGRFVTCVIAVFDPSTHRMTVSSAGHMPPLLKSKAGEISELGREESGLPLGLLEDQQYQEFQLDLEPSDTVVMYTDGVTDARNPNRELYGVNRLRRFVAQGPANVQQLVNGIVDEVTDFCEGLAYSDDMCIVSFRRT